MSLENIEVRPVRKVDRAWIRQMSIEYWSSEVVVTRGKVYLVEELQGFIAFVSGDRVGLLTYFVHEDSLEIITLNSLLEKQGVGTALLTAVEEKTREIGFARLWLITTNDNLEALGFYQKRGYSIASVYSNAIEKSRQLKPEIPLVSESGIPIRDEIELEKELT
ncbi:MAG: GNAT family N-acetyltransferase [Candidatus Thorarchaeota archaeon]